MSSDKTSVGDEQEKRRKKTKSKAHLIKTTINQGNIDDENNDDAYFDLKTCINESGDVDNFLNTSCMVLYKRNLFHQG